jgi:2-oxoisovalerate dehydrogenase E1 component alpha subunit
VLDDHRKQRVGHLDARVRAARGGQITDRAKAFGIHTARIDGNDPEVAYRELMKAMDYVRSERKPFLLEATVSRLYGHSSASGANFVANETDCLALFEKTLDERRILSRTAMEELRARVTQELLEATKRVREEPPPSGSDIWKHVFAEKDLVGVPPEPKRDDERGGYHGRNGAA